MKCEAIRIIVYAHIRLLRVLPHKIHTQNHWRTHWNIHLQWLGQTANAVCIPPNSYSFQIDQMAQSKNSASIPQQPNKYNQVFVNIFFSRSGTYHLFMVRNFPNEKPLNDEYKKGRIKTERVSRIRTNFTYSYRVAYVFWHFMHIRSLV